VPAPETLGLGAGGRASGSQPATRSFVSEPRLHPPIVKMTGTDTDTAAGDFFLTAQNSGHNGPYMLNPAGDLLWYHQTASSGHGPAAFNFRVQSYQGQPVLTYWEGHLTLPTGYGNGVGLILNEHYTRIHTVTAGAGYQRDGIDEHELTLGPNGTAWVVITAPVHANLRSVGGPSNGTVLDSIAQEIDISTNRVLWEWDALHHVPLRSSYVSYIPGRPYDFFHLNSIQPLPNGHVILSARHTWAVYSVTEKTKKIDWELGGKHSSFNMGTGTRFYWQHDAQLHSGGLLTVFDDGDAGGTNTKEESQSRALEIALHFRTRRATLAHAYTHRPPLLAASQGNVQLLPNRNAFVGWGSQPDFSEYTQGASQIFSGSFIAPVNSYRAYRFNDFVGQPLGPPAVAVRRSSLHRHDAVYMSWNGATRVAKWRVQAGRSARGPFATVISVGWTSFETWVRVAATAGPYFRVQALDSGGNVLPNGTSVAAKGP